MSSLLNTPSSARAPRAGGHRPLLASLAILFAAGHAPLLAQQQGTGVVRTRSLRAERSDAAERQVRALQRQLDSLTRVYNDHDDLTLIERQRVGEALGRTVNRLEAISTQMNLSPEDMMRPADRIRIQMAPQMAERAAAAMSRALMQVHEAEQARPQGWIGLVVQGPGLTPRIEDGELLVRYFAYPRVLSVDPSSPAQRAGLVPNDTLLAYDGVDVSENDISFTRLLRPNTRVSIRIRRDGRVLEVPVTVALAPRRILQRRDDETRALAPWTVGSMLEAPPFPRIRMTAPAPGAPTRLRVRSPAPPVVPAAPAPSSFAEPPMPMIPFGFSLGGGVAGAQLSTIGEGLGRALGVRSGVLVTSAPTGSPARESGLTDGDVITKVAGQAVRRVTDVRDLVALASENGDHAVELEIVRQKTRRTLMLRW